MPPISIARMLPLHSGDTLALMSARTLRRTEGEITSRLPAIVAVARDFLDRELGGPLVQAHLRDLVIHAGAAVRAMGDLEGGVASQGFVTQAYLRDDLGQSSVRRPRGVAVFALRTDCETYASLGELEGAPARRAEDIHDISYATAHELVLTAKLVCVHAGATPSASAILDTAATVAPKLATAHLPLGSPTFSLVALHGLLRTSGIAPLARFAEDAPRVASDIERGAVARLATTYASLRPCFASRAGAPAGPHGGDVQMDVNGVYINLEPAPVKVAIIAAREDCEAYRVLSGRSAVFAI
jgi:hypothetical protein